MSRAAATGMRDALTAEITSLRRTGAAAAPRAELASGRATGGARYACALVSWPPDLSADGALVARAGGGGPWVPVSEVVVDGAEVRLACAAELGAGPVFVRADPARSAVALRSALDAAVGSGLAPVLLGERPGVTGEAPDAAEVTTGFDKLNLAQRRALTRALGSDLAFVWGPPGTGKTDVLARVVEGSLRRGQTVLLTAPTAVAVDHALERICDLIGTLPGFDEGLVRRLGPAAVPSLVRRHGAAVDTERVLARLSAPLAARAGGLRERQREVAARLRDREAADAAHARVVAADGVLARHHGKRRAVVTFLTTVDSELAAVDARLAEADAKLFAERRADRLRVERADLTARRAAGLTDLAAVDAAIARARGELAELRSVAAQAVARAGGASVRALRAAADGIADKVRRVDAELAGLPKRVLDNCRLVAMTTQRGHLGGLPVVPDVVVVDEAGMVDLPTAVRLASQAEQRVVFAGDTRQLPPAPACLVDRHASTQDRALVRRWLARDVFRAAGAVDEDGQATDDPRLARLGTQYRMRPAISALVNAVAYPDGPTRTGRSDVSSVARSRVLGAPLVLVDTSGHTPASTYRDQLHAALVRECVGRLEHEGVLPWREPRAALAAITPYRTQARVLDAYLREHLGPRFAGVADTVHRYQGDQRPVVILDTVAGPFYSGTGKDSATCRLVNVALSRAQDHLVVVANVDRLRATLPGDSEMHALLDHLRVNAERLPVEELVPVRTADQPPSAGPAFVPAAEVDEAVALDIGRAADRVEIYSPEPAAARVAAFAPALREAASRGVPVRLFTPRPPAAEDAGWEVVASATVREPLVITDNTLWHPPFDLLAATAADAPALRMESAVACTTARPRPAPVPAQRVAARTHRPPPRENTPSAARSTELRP
ncbi:AAA domain-containing protein [Actinokineospora auranticolor]|uniref:AAA domain-containing protein n=1 Tax=Actinokineospora auranticolor TaxID=155976 RepID=A0A2S6GFL9_9PSEU|nr:AAA domain-containing protein [Actinokineospora auranticolor]PPK64018.1 AAA domain-containing protein [Actinokineospora auranticolor]